MEERAKKEKRGSVAAISMDTRLMKAMAHPMRMQIMAVMNKPGILLSPIKFADKIEEPLSNVDYHFKQLEKYDCIDLAEEVQRRGATEHLYRASRRVLFNVEEWAQLPAIMKAGTAGRALSDYLLTAREAIEAGTFEARNDSHLSYTTIRVDERGWCKGSEILADALDKLLKLEDECKPRIERGAEALDATYGLGFFESPRADLEADD